MKIYAMLNEDIKEIYIMCICGGVIEAAAVGATAVYIFKKCRKNKCKCSCHKEEQANQDLLQTVKKKENKKRKKDEQERLKS